MVNDNEEGTSSHFRELGKLWWSYIAFNADRHFALPTSWAKKLAFGSAVVPSIHIPRQSLSSVVRTSIAVLGYYVGAAILSEAVSSYNAPHMERKVASSHHDSPPLSNHYPLATPPERDDTRRRSTPKSPCTERYHDATVRLPYSERVRKHLEQNFSRYPCKNAGRAGESCQRNGQNAWKMGRWMGCWEAGSEGPLWTDLITEKGINRDRGGEWL